MKLESNGGRGGQPSLYFQMKERKKLINQWIERAKVVTQHGYALFDELFEIKLLKDGEFIGYFDSKKEAIRYAERRLGIE